MTHKDLTEEYLIKAKKMTDACLGEALSHKQRRLKQKY